MDHPKPQPLSVIAGIKALSPAIMFLLVYVGISLLAHDFYAMPVTVALLVASVWGLLIMRGSSLGTRIEAFSRGAANTDILYMIWIFILAGAFAALAKDMGAIDATVNLTFRIFPSYLILPACFFAACIISFAIGTSVGAVVALTPLIVEISQAADQPIPLFVAAGLGGAFFGDNLSFISDTTIAATRTQRCALRDKFRANIRVVLPAAVVTLAIYAMLGGEMQASLPHNESKWWLTLPYLTVIITAISGLNVMLVLLAGILMAIGLGICAGIGVMQACRTMGNGIDSMGQLIIITMLAAGMLALIKAMGGIDFLLRVMTSHIRSRAGAKWCIAALVSLVNLCTANNTIAILTVGDLSRKISTRFDIAPMRTASLLDSCSCIVQCLIPYGAQSLLAAGLAGISPGAMWPYLYYPWILALAVAASISFGRNPQKNITQV